jgi:hypothetical protein
VPVDRRYLPRILRDRSGGEVLVPATLVGSSAADALDPLSAERATELVAASLRGGGLWVVRGEPWARVVTGAELLSGDCAYLRERETPSLFDGDRPRALLVEPFEPVDLIVPVDGWDPGQSYYFHRDAPLFATVAVLRKRDHKVTVVRGRISDAERKIVGRRIVEGQTCGVLTNELGGLCVVPDGEIASDVRAVYAERVRFIVDGLRDLATAARVLHEWSARFRDAADTGWRLERPIDNSFLYAVNRRRLRTLLPLPAPGALVPVGPARDVALPPPVGELPPGSNADVGGGGDGGGHPDLAAIAPLAAAAAASATHGEVIEPGLRLAESLIDRFAADLLDRALDPAPYHEAPRDPDDVPVLRRGVFRRPRGRLLRLERWGRPLVAVVRVSSGGFEVLQGSVPAEVATRVRAAVAGDPSMVGDWGLCRGAFGYVLAEAGTPVRAIESLSSSTSFAHLLDGAQRLDDAANRLRFVAERLDGLAAEGWTLSQPIAGFWLRLRAPSPYG